MMSDELVGVIFVEQNGEGPGAQWKIKSYRNKSIVA
jgi:hypothetical protein